MKHNWKHIKFGDAFNLQMGKTPARANSAYWSNGLYDWVSISDMPNGKYIQGTKEKISQKAVDETGIHLVKKGTALMSFKLTIGKTAIAPYDLYTNEAIMAFEPKDGTDVLADFLYYYLQLYEWDGNRAVMGNTTNKGVISNSYAYIPSLSEQESIVAELDAINHLIDLQEKQLREYDCLAQSLFYSTFGDFKKECKWKCLDDLYKFIDYRGKTPNKIDMGIPLITARNVRFGLLDYTVRDFISAKEYAERQSRGIAHKGDILFTTEAPLGYAALADMEVFSTGQRIIALQAKNDKEINNIFALRYILSDDFQHKLLQNATGATAKGIKAEKLKRIQIPLPPLALQQTFAAQIEAIEQQKALIRRSLDETRTLLAARMQYYFE